MVGTTFDGLYQRQKRRVLRRVLTMALAGIVVLGGFLAYALVQNTRIREQNLRIEAQNTELTDKNRMIEQQNTELTDKNQTIEAQNRRIEEERTAASRNECELLIEKSVYCSSVNRKNEATQLALDALSVSETVDGFAKDEAMDALAVSCSMGDFAVEAKLDFPGMVNYDPYCCFSPDGAKIAVTDSRTGLTLCDAATGERLWVSAPFSHDITSVSWNAESTLLVVTARAGHTVCLIDASTGDHLKELYVPWAVNAVFEGENVLIAFAQGLVRWETAVSDDNLPFVFRIDEDQYVTSLSLQGGRYITLCQSSLEYRIFVQEISSPVYACVDLPEHKVVNGYTVSPDGEWIFVHQFDQCYIMNLATDEIRWKVPSAQTELTADPDCGPVWCGDIILDCGSAFSAQTGEVLYETENKAAGVTPDGRFFYDASAFRHLSDGSWFADVPGDLKAVSPAGDYLVVYHATLYGKGLPGNPDAVAARTKEACLELAPGTGSQYIAEKYEGTILEIPDYTEPEHEEGTMLALKDPYGTAATGYIMSRSFFSPNGRYHIVMNLGAYIPFYDLEKSNEPIARIYDFSVGDHVEAVDVSFSADSRYAAIAGAAGQFIVYELETGRMVRSFTDTYLARSLSEVKFNARGNYLMVADFNCKSFRICSVSNGQTVYTMHAVREVASWGFDEATGDAVVCYDDGSALIARMFEDEETLLGYAREKVKDGN